jgi:phage shock protein C
MEPKQILRTRKDKILGGVCGGLGRYLNVDPVFIRILFVLLVLGWGTGILIYLIAWILIPLEPEEDSFSYKVVDS